MPDPRTVRRSWLDMINPLLASAVFIDYLLLFLHLSHHVRAISFDPLCWKPIEGAPTLVFKECLDIVNNQVIPGYDLNLPLKFSHNSDLQPDIQLPKMYTSSTGNCFVGIDLSMGKTGYDRASMSDIRRAAQAVGVECIIKPPHRGGIVELGWYDKMSLVFLVRKRRIKNETLSTE
ncbi:MAG: hypothetical protein Q9218_000045 [Villophora microphyllina]